MHTDNLVAYMVALANRNSESLGFVESSRMAERVARGHVITETDNGDLCGYLMHGVMGDWVHIHQAVIQADARKAEHGRRLVQALAARAKRAGCQGISLRCRAGLPSNDFWTALGFTHIATTPGGSARGKPINVYQIAFDDAFSLFTSTGHEMPQKDGATCLYLPNRRSGFRLGAAAKPRFETPSMPQGTLFVP